MSAIAAIVANIFDSMRYLFALGLNRMSLNLATRDTSAFGVLESQTRYNRSSQSFNPAAVGKTME